MVGLNMRQTLKSMGIERTVINKHGVGWWVYKYKGLFFGTKQHAIKAYEKDLRSKNMKLKPPKVTPTTYASCTKKAIKRKSKKKWKV